MSTHDFKPSEVRLSFLPLIGTLGRTEREIAAALIVRTCQVNGDTWQPVTPRMIGDTLRRDVEDGVEPFASLNGNPFARPDFWDLVAQGYASGDPSKDEPLALTDKALVAISKWRAASPSNGEPKEGGNA